MYKALYERARSITVVSARLDEPGAGHVRIDVAYTGVCGTDLHIFHGDMDGRVRAPQVIGHEMSGRIAAVGEGVADWAVGDPVTVLPLQSCGDCPACRTGNRHLCHNLVFIGIDAAGAMQQSWIVPAHTLVALPPSVDLRDAALVEPTAVAVHDVRRAQVNPGEQVLVVGGGPVGVLIALVARNAGADVLIAEISPDRRALAESFGLRTIDPITQDLAATIDDWTEHAGVPVAFEVSGAAAGVTAAVDALAVRGRLCLVAIHPQPREVSLHRFFWRELTLIGARLYDRSDFETAVELIADGTIPAADLVTRIVPLHRAQEAFDALETGGEQMKVLVDCAAEPA